MSTTRDRARPPLRPRRSTAAGGVVLRNGEHGAEVALLGRLNDGSWVLPKGTPTTGESLEETALREVREETGLDPARLYNVSRVEAFYRHRTDEIALIPVFAAVVDGAAEPRASPEHDRVEWLAPAAAAARFAWPRERRALDDVLSILGSGDAGLLEDVLRIC